jgi:hypothetical protein
VKTITMGTEISSITFGLYPLKNSLWGWRLVGTLYMCVMVKLEFILLHMVRRDLIIINVCNG